MKKKKLYEFLLKLTALFIPFYLVFYAPMYDRPESPLIKRTWKYIMAGFILYAAALAAYVSLIA